MGRKKKFIDKKNSAVFQLFSRDTSNDSAFPDSASSDRIFVRVDNNPYSNANFIDEDAGDSFTENLSNLNGDQNNLSIFADAEEEGGSVSASISARKRHLPDHTRKAILELGLPDDGYNYLVHLREIKHSGGGALYHQNHKARMDLVPLDVKAYDASTVRVKDSGLEDEEESLITAVAEKTVPVRVNKAIDEEVNRLLDDGEWSMFGSDVEELEENFVVQANLPVGDEHEEEEKEVFVEADVRGESGIVDKKAGVAGWLDSFEDGFGSLGGTKCHEIEGTDDDLLTEKERTQRLLDVQFDLLALQEYGSDSDDNDVKYEESEGKALATKLNHALKNYHMDEMDLEDKYKVPGDFKNSESANTNLSAEIIRKCAEYAEMYGQEDEDSIEEVLVEESSDESEIWDCETIVTTYTNLDNHPGKIQAPGKIRKKLPQLLPGASGENGNIINLRGKEKFPVDFLPNSKRISNEKVKKVPASIPENPQTKRSNKESKEDKKERKAVIKEERREARRAKKELKGLYRGESQRAQKVAAFSGPSSVHLT